MSGNRAKCAILRRWRDAMELAANYRELRLFAAVEQKNYVVVELADLFAELHPGEDIDEAWRDEQSRQLTQDEYDALVRTEGATYAAWEGASRSLSQWRAEHPDDERDDLELATAADGPFASREQDG